MADAGDLDEIHFRGAFAHLRRDLGAEQVGGLAAHQQGRTALGQAGEEGPQIGDQGLGPRRPDRGHDVGVIVRDGRALGAQAEGATGEGVPIGVRIMGQGDLIELARIGGGIGPVVDLDRLARIGGDPRQTDGRNLRPDIVEDGGGDDLRAEGGERHGDQPAHGGAEEDGALDAEVAHQGQHVLGIGRGLVGHRVRCPVRLAATADVHGQHPPAALGDQGGDGIEIGRVAGEAMDGDDRQFRGAGRRGMVAGIEAQSVGTGPAALDEGLAHERLRRLTIQPISSTGEFPPDANGRRGFSGPAVPGRIGTDRRPRSGNPAPRRGGRPPCPTAGRRS